MEFFKYQSPSFYARLFDGYEEGPFDVIPGSENVGAIRKTVPGATKLYVFQDIKSDCVSCYFVCYFFFVGEKVAAYCFKDDIITLFKVKYRVQLSLYVEFNRVR